MQEREKNFDANFKNIFKTDYDVKNFQNRLLRIFAYRKRVGTLHRPICDLRLFITQGHQEM